MAITGSRRPLWIEESTEGLEETIEELRNDVANLNDIAIKADFDPVEIAQGSVDLLAEVSASKITGEEERYSHTDLWDFQANVEGAEAGFEALEPAVEQVNPELVDEIEAEFEAMYALLDEHREGNGFVLYDFDARGPDGPVIDLDAHVRLSSGDLLGPGSCAGATRSPTGSTRSPDSSTPASSSSASSATRVSSSGSSATCRATSSTSTSSTPRAPCSRFHRA